MEYVLAIGLTFLLSLAIIKLSTRKSVKGIGRIVYSQTSIHERTRHFMPKNLYQKPEVFSQSRKHVEQHMVKIIVIDNKAYWVKDNVFYFAETDNGDIVDVTAKPVDISSMSKQDMDKMLFILDNLRKGKKDDSGSSGDE